MRGSYQHFDFNVFSCFPAKKVRIDFKIYESSFPGDINILEDFINDFF